jgi:NAD(P)-dependent dehydrogenase (short-subunit alcohol dehydrogenase family)
MEQAVLEVAGLPDAPLDAAATFHAEYLPLARAALAHAGALVLKFAPAGYEHRSWRLAAVQELAREAAPKRVNGMAGDNEADIAETLAYLAAAPGITGQLLTVDGKSGETR